MASTVSLFNSLQLFLIDAHKRESIYHPCRVFRRPQNSNQMGASLNDSTNSGECMDKTKSRGGSIESLVA